MSRKNLTPVNMPALASAPTTPTPVNGDHYFNTTTQIVYVYNGTAWVAALGSQDATVANLLLGGM